MTTLLDDPLKPKKPSPFGAALPGTMANSQQGPGLSANSAGPQHTLGDPNAPPPPVADPAKAAGTPFGPQVPFDDGGVGTFEPPAAPPVGGGADFPSLPPGATPPPGYFDPISGKTAPSAPSAAPAGAPGAPPAPGAPASAPPPANPGMPAPAPSAPGAPPTTVNDAFRKALIDGMTRPVPTLDDPTLKGQTDAYAVQQQRAKERSREALAERGAATGQVSDLAGSGAFDQGLVGLEQAQGEAQGAFNANLLGSETRQQRDELRQWAALAGDTLSGEEQRALQDRLSQLDAQIQREQIASGERLGGQDVDLRKYGIDTQGRLGEGQLNADLLRILLGNDQFNKGLGADLGKFGASRDDMNFWKSLGLI